MMIIKKGKHKDNWLCSNCSEYVARIKLTPEELVKAKEMAVKFQFSEEDLKYFNDYLVNGTDEDQNGMGSFIEEEYTKPYIFIKESILEDREKYNIAKQRWWDREKNDNK